MSGEKMYPIDENLITTVDMDKNDVFDYFMVDPRTKVLIFGDGVDSFENTQGILCNTDIESIRLEGNHKSLLLIDGILYEKIEEFNSIYKDDFLSEYSYLDSNPQSYLTKLSLLFIPPKMKIKQYIIPNLCIEFSPFSICNNYLEEIVFHNDFLFMADSCFNECINIKSIHLPPSLVCIDEYPLSISGLEKITIDPKNKYFSVKNNALLNYDGTELIAIPLALKTEVYEIPNGVIKAEEYLPANEYIKKIIIPNTIPSFTNYAFCEGNSMLSSFPSLMECVVKANNPHFSVIDGVLYSKDLKKLIYYPNFKIGEEYTLIDTCISFEISSLICLSFLKKMFIPNPNFNFKSLDQGLHIAMEEVDTELYKKTKEGYELVDWDDVYL